MLDLVINSSIQHTLLLFIPLLFAVILKLSKVRSWSLLAGVLGGVLLGPAVFGSIAPSYWEGLFQGGVSAHVQYEQFVEQQNADFIAAKDRGVNETVLLQLKADQHYDRAQKEQAWVAATWKDQRTLRDYVIVLIILIFLSGTVRGKVRGTAPPMMSLSVGVWAAIIPCGITALLVIWFLDSNVASALAFGACLAAGPWTLTRWEQKAADDSEQGGAALMLRCGHVAWLTASCIALYATWHSLGAMSFVWLLPLLCLPFMWRIPSKQWKLLTLFVDYAAIPSVMATCLVLIHPIEDLALWPIVIVIIFCADARWLGGIIGLGILGGRESGSAMRLATPLVDAGISQLCMAALLFGAGVLTPSFTLAVLLGAVFLDRTASIRMKFAKN